jgi:hypothetical protein
LAQFSRMGIPTPLRQALPQRLLEHFTVSGWHGAFRGPGGNGCASGNPQALENRFFGGLGTGTSQPNCSTGPPYLTCRITSSRPAS